MGKVVVGKTDLETLFPEIAQQWHPPLNGEIVPKQVATHSNKSNFWICSKGHVFEASPDQRVRGDYYDAIGHPFQNIAAPAPI